MSQDKSSCVNRRETSTASRRSAFISGVKASMKMATPVCGLSQSYVKPFAVIWIRGPVVRAEPLHQDADQGAGDDRLRQILNRR